VWNDVPREYRGSRSAQLHRSASPSVMTTRSIAVALLSTLLLGATSSSQSLFTLSFPSTGSDSARLTEVAKEKLRERGFGPADGEGKLQYGTRAAWVEIHSRKPDELELYFNVYRGGCSNEPGVPYAQAIVSGVAASMMQEFGVPEIHETRAANNRPNLRGTLEPQPGNR
jgi:hypothetical protein